MIRAVLVRIALAWRGVVLWSRDRRVLGACLTSAILVSGVFAAAHHAFYQEVPLSVHLEASTIQGTAPLFVVFTANVVVAPNHNYVLTSHVGDGEAGTAQPINGGWDQAVQFATRILSPKAVDVHVYLFREPPGYDWTDLEGEWWLPPPGAAYAEDTITVTATAMPTAPTPLINASLVVEQECEACEIAGSADACQALVLGGNGTDCAWQTLQAEAGSHRYWVNATNPDAPVGIDFRTECGPLSRSVAAARAAPHQTGDVPNDARCIVVWSPSAPQVIRVTVAGP